jgi:ABC-type multidrug transport system ATPase subunit
MCLASGRTIIFTTHHLDEAEMLSDHVAVLQQGRLRCYAPPADLKETYGQGLTLTLSKQVSSAVLLFHWGSPVGPHHPKQRMMLVQ